jgi:hypothetical protein
MFWDWKSDVGVYVKLLRREADIPRRSEVITKAVVYVCNICTTDPKLHERNAFIFKIIPYLEFR